MALWVCFLSLLVMFTTIQKPLSVYNVGSAMPMPNYPAPGPTGAYRPTGSNTPAAYQPYPPPYTSTGQPSQSAHIPPTQPPYPGYQPYSQTTQAYAQPTGKTYYNVNVVVCVTC